MTTLEDVLKFPCEFNIKIMGVNDADIINEITKIIQKYDAKFSSKNITTKPSSKGNFIAINAVINAISKLQLDDIYRELNAHNLVRITL